VSQRHGLLPFRAAGRRDDGFTWRTPVKSDATADSRSTVQKLEKKHAERTAGLVFATGRAAKNSLRVGIIELSSEAGP